MTIAKDRAEWIGELSKTRRAIAVETQGHGRTANVSRDFTYENIADDVDALLKVLELPRADLVGDSMGGAVAMQCAIRHPKGGRHFAHSQSSRPSGWSKRPGRKFPLMLRTA